MAIGRGRKPKPWTLPLWMKPFEGLIINTGGNSVEDLMNDNTSPLINLPRSTLAACVKSQVGLLTVLHAQGLLAEQRPQGQHQFAAHRPIR